ncbi:hypothetical protein EDD21DRAFT_194832 [Dissophora ornata]|nr:hypothetical protein EDD21DRAFT_194832 [Dissophora ornata]
MMQTLQLREAALESIAFFTNQLLDPSQPQLSVEKTQAYLKLFETLIWQLQDDEAEVREEATLIVSRGTRLSYAVSSEKALTLIYDHQTKIFAGKDASETQVQLLVESLVSGLVQAGEPGKCLGSHLFEGGYPHTLNENLTPHLFTLARLVAESLQPSKMLFDKESPNLYREPLVSMQLTQRSLEQILSRPDLPTSVLSRLASFQQECIQQVAQVEKAIEDWRSSEARLDRSPWGVSGRKPVFEVLYQLASGSNLLKSKGENTSADYLEIIRDASKVHPVVIEASQCHEKTRLGRLFLIE